MENELRLSDEVIGQIAKLVQIAILTGTDIVDNMRMIRLTTDNENESKLVLADSYRELARLQVEKLMEDLENNQALEVDEEV